ncbi:uncharacterized protein BO96DRAFT_430685 [Aspergillus niger CBS 101883]|uniref:Secreted protein n=2 Tax=Aspergillus niger TaxID=5061 RepID=A2QUN7_ASPNC|nr:uncharacterized protein BO96DRAFT_430685 [Aspergillus niger CBS 101883]XP_059601458.1 hypothetical protein An09g06265 [Aspergillus niger]PYH60777.1 hypothetical protein BO96DRAFT_430685 [Aspergillus niger CBS 101883]CAK40417.1 hypothetical protein An09g06265 [Aspergillus niger]
MILHWWLDFLSWVTRASCCQLLSTVVNRKNFCLKALGCTAKPVPAIYDLCLPRVIEAVQHPAERPENLRRCHFLKRASLIAE